MLFSIETCDVYKLKVSTFSFLQYGNVFTGICQSRGGRG